MKSLIVNVLDLELTCWPDGKVPPGQRKEIIEAGLTTIDLSSLTIGKSLSFPVIPTMSEVSPFCTELTDWTEAKLKRQGMTMKELVRRLATKHGAKNRVLVTDSGSEAETFRTQCELMGIDYPFGNETHNVSTMFSMLTKRFENLSLKEKLRLLGLEFEGRPHSGVDDSRNIARLLIAVIQRGSFQLV